ncbi:arylesterase [Inmirania thermothiophila]|uniref:Acyl-CoA thioesterase-1 n=1 Tax=Inmirania thermothiophila TaxID=1750597 RepID=A0A3N1Y8R2_9GAMM|nr:acyl-CoA thioesterase-1 [Inmirania thermothiophila]
MRRLPLIVLALVLAAAGAGGRPVLLVLGDSLSAGYGLAPGQGWVDLLGRRLAERGYPHRVVNASVSGETSGGGLERLPALLARHRPAVVVVELGGNDGLRGLGLERTRANLAAVVRRARAAGARVLLVGMRLPPNYGPLYTRRFAALYREIARDEGVPLVPFLLEGVALAPGMMQADGIHPTAAAQPRLLDNVWPHLEPLLR